MAAHAGLIDVHRGDVLESEHVGSIAVVNAAGELLAYCGDIRRDVFTRSSLKPFQAAPFVASGGLEKFGWGLRQLALMCASHSGETQHISLARSMLADCGLDHRHLLCGCQVPIAYTQAARLPRADEVFSELHHNCSGKHSGFLAACLQSGEPIENYVALEHPLQRRIRESLAQALRRDSPFQLGVDGCAAPNLAMPLPQLAQLFAVMSAERLGLWWRFSGSSVLATAIKGNNCKNLWRARFVMCEVMRLAVIALCLPFQSLERLEPRSLAGSESQPLGSAKQPLIDSMFLVAIFFIAFAPGSSRSEATIFSYKPKASRSFFSVPVPVFNIKARLFIAPK
ncbi:MAG: hypothetical protein EBX90_02545 [Betaproteobacteria bacterium]|nr:hypothetical protein [Betaproteobacteria bacterium]